jgi:hypothetical protein
MLTTWTDKRNDSINDGRYLNDGEILNDGVFDTKPKQPKDDLSDASPKVLNDDLPP